MKLFQTSDKQYTPNSMPPTSASEVRLWKSNQWKISQTLKPFLQALGAWMHLWAEPLPQDYVNPRLCPSEIQA